MTLGFSRNFWITLSKKPSLRQTEVCRTFLLVLLFASSAFAQIPSPTPTPTPTLGLEQGFQEFETPEFKLKLVKASQTVAALQPNNSPDFDFTPGDRLGRRAANGYYHLGDLIFRIQKDGKSHDYSTVTDRKPVFR